jgi:hypothetical protein
MVSYAHGGSSGGPDTLDAFGQYEHHYPTPGLTGIEFAKPTPAHALTPPALEAVEAMRRAGWQRRIDERAAELVTNHDNPRVRPYTGPIPAGAKRLLALALSKGMTAQIVTSKTGHTVEGIDPKRGVAFRATWSRGSASGGSWHEKRDRYIFVEDARAVGVNALTKTGLKGRRPAGVDRVHLKAVALRDGMPYNVTEIERKVSEL